MSKDLERKLEILDTLRLLKTVPPAAKEMLDKVLQQKLDLHTEKCCATNLTAEESAKHKEARALSKELLGFFDKRAKQLGEELDSLNQRISKQ